MSYLRRTAILAVALSIIPFMSFAQNHERTDSLVRLMNAASVQLIQENARNYRKAIDARFLHNDTYLSADTTLWDVDEQVIHFKGNVKITQDETILTSETMDYRIDKDLAQFRGTLVQLRDKDGNILRSSFLDYNTRDSMAVFGGGGSMCDKDGQVIESLSGIYESRLKLFTFREDVNMYSDTVFMKTPKLTYQTDSSKASFYDGFDAWKRGDMLSSKSGWYDRNRNIFFFQDNVHGMTADREMWSDTMYFYQATNDVKMLGNVQLKDSTRNVIGVADYFYYNDSTSTATMRRNAAVIARTEGENGAIDTLYVGADKFIYRATPKYQIPEAVLKGSEQRLKDLDIDPITAYRRKAAEEAAKAAAEAAKDDPNDPAAAAAKAAALKLAQDASAQKQSPQNDTLTASVSAKDTANSRAAADSVLAKASETVVDRDSVAMRDTVAILDSAAVSDAVALPDSLQQRPVIEDIQSESDSLAVADSVASMPPLDSTRIGFLSGRGRVRVYRTDMQVACDSLEYSDLDSLARLFLDPIVWNDANRQYNSDSLTVMIKNGRMDRASLMSNAFITIQEDSVCFDQIRGAEVMAYFDDSTSLRRFDALGGSAALFYLKENDAFATVNKVESKMLSALFVNGDIDRIFYFDNPKNDAYPVVQLPKDERKLKGFRWDPDKRPAGKHDITDIIVRKSERRSYYNRPQPVFKFTEKYFPGHMDEVRHELAQHDSLRRARRLAENALADSLANVPDSLAMSIDSLAVQADSLAGARDSLSTELRAAADSLAAAADSLDAAIDSLHNVVKRLSAREIREKRRADKEAAKQARWERLDARDAERAAKKEARALKKKRIATRKALIARQKEQERDKQKLDAYIRYYEKKKAAQAVSATSLSIESDDMQGSDSF